MGAYMPVMPGIALQQRIEQLAERSVSRRCGLVGLAVALLMVWLSRDFALATKAGGMLLLLACLVLFANARLVERRPQAAAQLWAMLDPSERPPETVAQRIAGAALEECYLLFALRAAGLAAMLLAISLAFPLWPAR